MGIRYLAVDTVVGSLWVAHDGHGVCLARLGDTDAEFSRYCARRLGSQPMPGSDPAIAEAVGARVTRDGPLDFDLSRCTGFQRRVLKVVVAIPRGQVRTYRQVGEQIGQPGAARAIGHALATNPIPVLIPCHRVIRTDGGLGGYTPRLETKSALLTWEGALADKDQTELHLESDSIV